MHGRVWEDGSMPAYQRLKIQKNIQQTKANSSVGRILFGFVI